MGIPGLKILWSKLRQLLVFQICKENSELLVKEKYVCMKKPMNEQMMAKITSELSVS